MREGDEWEEQGKDGGGQQVKGNWSENGGGKVEGRPGWEGGRKQWWTWWKKGSRLLSIVLTSDPKVETK